MMKRIFQESAKAAVRASKKKAAEPLSKSVLHQLLKEQKTPAFEWVKSDNAAFPLKGKLEINFTIGLHGDHPETPLYTVYYEDPTTGKAKPIMHINDLDSFVDDPFLTPPHEQDIKDAEENSNPHNL